MLTTTELVALLPTETCPNDKLEGVADRSWLLTPDPRIPTCRLGFWALLVIVIFVLAEPMLSGLNATVRATLWPALKVAGKLIPETLNSELPTLMAETVALVSPLLVRAIS